MLSSELGLLFYPSSSPFNHVSGFTFLGSFPWFLLLISNAFTWSVCAWQMVYHHGPFCIYLPFLFRSSFVFLIYCAT